MNFEDEKDYIMRMIKEVIRILISLVPGRTYTQVELPPENKYGLADGRISKLKDMVDRGEINEAENILLDDMDYTDKAAVAELIFFYEYTSQKPSEFLEQHNYSQEEILEGLKMSAAKMGYQNIMDMLEIF